MANMRDLFPGYYRPTKDQFDDLWNRAVVAFDANVLLNVYRYSPPTRQALFDLLHGLQSRIWVPHQAALEYQVNRGSVILEQMRLSEDLEKRLDKQIGGFKDEIERMNRHPYLNRDQLQRTLQRARTQILKEFDRERHSYTSYLDDDDLRDQLDDLFDGRVGPSYTEAELADIYKDGAQRFKQLIPPGYMDADKEEGGKPSPKRYGDFIVWRQLIDHAIQTNLPVILVTDDTKEDWWSRRSGRTFGPRPELVQEMIDKASVGFYMYTSEGFLQRAADYLKVEREKEAEEEARVLREQQEHRTLQRRVTAKQLEAVTHLLDDSNSRLYNNLGRTLDTFLKALPDISGATSAAVRLADAVVREQRLYDALLPSIDALGQVAEFYSPEVDELQSESIEADMAEADEPVDEEFFEQPSDEETGKDDIANWDEEDL